MSLQRDEPIAIIGSGCRFPGDSTSPSALWELLKEPRDVLTEIPVERFNPAGFYHEDGMHHGSTDVHESYLLSDDYRHFDAQFFNINPMEANSMDPQQRLLLETVYESTESAGLPIDDLRGSPTAVFVGLMCEEYSNHLLRDPETTPIYMATGTARSIMSNRISYFFDWHGPSMTIDTACSSSLVAVHLAAGALRSGESRIAIAAGANLILSPEPYIGESKLKMLSPGSRSRMWDADADGYARGDGVAAIVLKTLSAALEDGDNIECVIRSTGVNQDGRTKGITMPSATAQEALIRETYEKSGLNPRNRQDRCQYFEAHGTGTPAGDPIESEAISHVFFDSDNSCGAGEIDDAVKLYVGSIKTVIGHTEGTAGLAGVIKSVLAIKNKTIPPNMLFKKLSPAVKPFYDNLKIPTVAIPWPVVPSGCPRRASVNSFGFGGTNAHVILESFDPILDKTHATIKELHLPLPFVFSATSTQSLARMVAAYSAYLKTRNPLDLRDLAHTLYARRSALPIKATFSALNHEQLWSKLDSAIATSTSDIGTRSSTSSPRILGVFTGQGAQWVGMGKELLARSAQVQEIISRLDERLACLPAEDRPSWTLKGQLLAEASESRVHEAGISQPLCTAIQVALVDLLYESGAKFEAVVGHSSGEIGAAYAAGYISANDAIIIAYYRGLYAHLGSEKVPGAMLAASTSMEDAIELCEFPEFEGRIVVAAWNSSSSVTLSGDANAIEDAKTILEDEKKFARLLKVDTAYHSHHMVPCADPYVKSLESSDIKVSSLTNTCSWFSSVEDGELMGIRKDLEHTYWKDNMIKPVLFSTAIQRAIAMKGPFSIALEIGPHPSLQGPALQTIQELTGQTIPYAGLLRREKDAAETVSDALCFVWQNLGPSAINLSRHISLFSQDQSTPRTLKDLPTYSWDHERIYWFESRATKAFRTRSQGSHELLGTACIDNTEEAWSWRNHLRPNEISWLSGHKLQDQMIFPAAGYAVTVLEGMKALAITRPVKVIELRDFSIGRPMSFEEDDAGVEVVFALTNIETQNNGETTIMADFTYHAGLGNDPDRLTLMASGQALAVFGDPSLSLLPARPPLLPNLVDVESDLFYESLNNLGYGYSGPFRALSDLKRKLDIGTGLLINPHFADPKIGLIIHPGLLDATFQSLFLAFCWPGDGSLKELYVPTKIQSIRINPYLCDRLSQDAQLSFDCTLTHRTSMLVRGDVALYPANGGHAILQAQGVSVVPFAPSTEAHDRQLFSRIDWGLASIDGEAAASDDQPTVEEQQFASVAEQTALWYIQKLLDDVTEEQWANSEWHHKQLLHYATDTVSSVASGKRRFVQKEWLLNSRERIVDLMQIYPNSFELELLRAVGENLAAAVRGETNILEHMMRDNMLERLYAEGTGVGKQTLFLGRMVGQLAHRYPHMKILEIGAGTGGATKSVFKHIGQAFTSYTFTDISTGFFEKAQNIFEDHRSRIIFKALDIERDVDAQGFSQGTYDLVIASLVLHATASIEATLINARKLLKPGGFLIMCELTNPPPLRMGFVFGGLPGWWLGVDDGRTLSPCISSADWHTCLRKTGFSGVDTITPEGDGLVRPGFVIASQAIDQRVTAIRRPLVSREGVPQISELFILGGTALHTSQLVDRILETLRPYSTKITKVNILEDLDWGVVSSMSVALSITELDEPMFKCMTKEKLEGIKQLFDQARSVLWLTRGCRSANPYSNITVGFSRSLVEEMPHVRLQLLDIDPEAQPDPHFISESLLRAHMLDVWEDDRSQGSLLWSKEPEMVQEKSKCLIPRLIANKPRNDVYNSGRRVITKEIDPRKSKVYLHHTGSGYELKDIQSINAKGNTNDDKMVHIAVTHSLVSSIRLSLTTVLFLVLGSNLKNNKTVLGLAKTNASIVEVSSQWAFDCDIALGKEVDFLRVVANELVAHYVASEELVSTSVVIHEPHPDMAAALCRHALQNDINILFTTHDAEKQGLTSPWAYIHPMAPGHEIAQAIPDNTSLFVNFTSDTQPIRGGSSIQPCLPPSCKVVNRASLFGASSQLPPKAAHGWIPVVLHNSFKIQRDLACGNKSHMIGPTFSLEHVLKSSSIEPLAVVDWTISDTVPLTLEPIDSGDLFSADKTYILFGLTSDLGQSLCTWMVQRGARHVVMTSRHPKIEDAWIQSLQSRGATIKVFSNDITDKNALQMLVQEIRSTCPPVGGIANGAMVLQDMLINDLDIDNLLRVLKPKVDGSLYLDELFHDDNLQFCIFFSSLACVYGNPGQANYGGANAFMCALASQRRSRGRAASILHIGAVMGAGYVTREGTQFLLQSLSKAGWLWLSERDFQQSFAEAILLGSSDFEQNPEVLVGVRKVEPEEGAEKQWYDNPKLSHCANEQDNLEVKKSDTATVVSLKAKLLGANTENEVYEILKESFLAKLQVVLQLDLEGKGDSIIEKGADSLGIDSLIAVEIRSWFLKEFLVDIQVLKILGGATIGEILDSALVKLPRELIPNVTASDAPATTSTQGHGEIPLHPERQDSTSSASLVTGTLSRTPTSASSFVKIEKSQFISNTDFMRKEEMGFGQSRFWSLRSLLDDQTTFNIVCSGRLSGPLRVEDLDKAISKVAQMHEGLRTAFIEEGQVYRQAILPASTVHLERHTIANKEDVAREHKAMSDYVFDLEHGETLRIMLLSQSSIKHFLVIGYHHIVMDGISLEIFLSDISKAYNGEILAFKGIHYCDYSIRERTKIKTGQMDSELSFWRKEFIDAPVPLPLLPFSAIRSRQHLTDYNYNEVNHRVDSGMSSQIKEICKEHKVTPFHFYLAAFKTLLLRLLPTEDICIGMADANRVDNDILESIGMFLNLLPLRFRTYPKQTFEDALKETRRKVYAALANGKVPFNILLEELDVPRSATSSPMFQAFINYRQGVQERRAFGDCQVEGLEYQVARTSYDISLDIMDNPGGDSVITFMVQKALYPSREANILMEFFLSLLDTFSRNPRIGADSAPLFSNESIQKSLKLGQGPTLQSKWGATVCHQIDSIIHERGSAIAVKDGISSGLTYQALSDRSAAISAALLQSNWRDGSTVAVFQEPSSDWVSSFLAIMRIGGIYVPLDPMNSPHRLAAVVADCKPVAILGHEVTLTAGRFLAVGDTALIDVSSLPKTTADHVVNTAQPEGIAAIIYTSGSTGVPKGIILKHSGILNALEGASHDLSLGSPVVLQQTAFTFDMSLLEALLALPNGGTVYVVPKCSRRDPIAITEIIVKEHITLTFATPSEYMSWLHYGISLKYSSWTVAFSGGDTFTPSLKHSFQTLSKDNLRLYNIYGPTEISFTSHTTQLDYGQSSSSASSSERIPVGFAFRNSSTYIVDDKLELVPVGFPGEVVIGGAGVSPGYHNNDDLTTRTFLDDTYASSEYLARGWTKMLRTGDRGRLRDDGALIVEGRISGDTQIKLRGIRIDLQDIEAVILQSANLALRDVVVSFRSESQAIVAHVVFRPDYPVIRREGFLKHLWSSLPVPHYMRPTFIIPLDSLPMTYHMKVDRIAIQAIPIPRSEQSSESQALTQTESQLKKIWESVLSTEALKFHTLHADADFFYVGGNSALLVRLQSLIRKSFDVVLPLFQLFEASTLKSMASRIENTIPADTIDWEKETSLPSSLPGLSAISKPGNITSRHRTAKVVLLTGSTGFLGRSILRLLVDDAQVSKIHCVAVRQLDPQGERTLPITSEKIVVHLGDMTEPLLGLSETKFANLAQEVNIIIHNGAQRSFWEYYQLLRNANVSSTKELVRMAALHKIPIHFISSGGVFNFSQGENNFSARSATDFHPPTDGSNGYVASKWASEKCLENAAEAFGIPVCIYRTIPAVKRSSSPSAIKQEFLRLSREMKTLPASSGWTGEVDLLPVETVAQGICTSSVKDEHTGNAPSIRFIHYDAQVKLLASELSEYLESNCHEKATFKRIPALEWVGEIKKLDFKYLFASQNIILDSGDGSADNHLVSRR
ncbi:uncharacterized protein BP5553_06488 [Venustampulla echinocandica]|uniref:Carrier domain-containing protein n=1 Tax=Venustampulla echinocandica TaxID=2656787 RepID=A0A370TK27_9HELO|nr:uncharacterized protein BP5553_06488 [Venustampulla echinocandica]RDL35876.1 hypothetical protein BP5553_06488 [Venustampulla echinocandica]